MGMDPPLQGGLLLEAQFELVSSTTAAGTLYGIAVTLYCLYLRLSLHQLRDHDRRRQAQYMITYSTIIMTCALYYLVSNAWAIQDAYIKHSDFSGGPSEYEASTYHTQPVLAVSLVCQLAIDILTAVIQVWRLWVVWSGTRYARLVVILPLVSFLGFAAMQIGYIILDITLTDRDLIRSELHLGTAAFALRGAAIILPTILIAGFLTRESWRQSKFTGQSPLSSLYMNVVAMLIESYALESTWTIVSVILFSIKHPLEFFFGDTLTYIEIIACLLVLYRLELATRREYRIQTTHEPQVGYQNNMSSAHWNPTDAPSCVTEGTDTEFHRSENQEVFQGRGFAV